MAVPPQQHGPIRLRDAHPPAPAPPQATSDDSDELPPDVADVAREDEADDMVGVSMGRIQSRMKARLTPAEEKNRVLEREGGYFEPIPDINNVEADGLYLSQLPSSAAQKGKEAEQKREREQAESQVPSQVPSQKEAGRIGFTRSILKSSLPSRRRALSGDLANINFRKFLPDFGSLARRSPLPLHFKSDNMHHRGRDEMARSPEKPPSPPARRHRWSDVNGLATNESIGELQPIDGRTGAKHSYSGRPGLAVIKAQSPRRRSSSDHSLYLRASSTASSLDQRPQFENVHSQVNSRFKAIKDSLQDSSSRLLSMPTLHFPDMRTDWGYKSTMQDFPQRKASRPEDPDQPSVNGERSQQPVLNPVLAEAMSDLTGDVVVMGGYRGSILRSAKPPQRQLWVPMKVGLNLRRVDLEVGLTHEDEERMEDDIIPAGVLSHIGPVDICRRLMRRLGKCENAVNGDLRVWDYSYDWRLSPHLLSQRMIQFLEGLPCNAPDVPKEKRGATVIAHSLGGLIARHAVNQRPELFAGVLNAGVPQHCVNILGPLRSGDDVLLSSKVLTAQVNFTFRTSFVLLPESGRCFIDKQTKEEYPVDFFSASAWDEYRLSPCVNDPLPTAGKGFKDNIPIIGKRFRGSHASFDDTDSSATATDEDLRELPNELQRGHTMHPNAVNDFSHRAVPPIPNIPSLVGPTVTHHQRGPLPRPSAASTIPRSEALEYLERTLAEVHQFKRELAFNPAHQSDNKYPPFAVIFGKSVPTVYGARVWSREAIKHQDAYDDLAFAAGDGVCLASAAMMPPGYRLIKDGLVKSDRGHVGLLGDLDGVGQCLNALIRGRREGVGYGAYS